MQALILAGGASSRFWPVNGYHKCLMKIMGRPMILSLIEGLKEKGIKEVLIVQGPEKEIEKELNNHNIDLPLKYIVQLSPKGTGDAILKAEKLLQDQLFVFNAERVDARDNIDLVLKKLKDKEDLVVLAGETKTPWLYGILKTEGEKMIDLVEKPEKGKEPSNLKLVGTYLIPKKFLDYLKRVPQDDYSLIHALLLYAKEKGVKVADVGKETFALKYPWDLFPIRNYIFDNFLKEKVSKSAKVAKSAIIEGKVFIGDGVEIMEGVKIKGPCFIGKNCFLGNNALVRDYSDLEEESLVGGFAEVTRSLFQERVFTHSGYFGDSIVGKGCYIGAGVITANIRLDKKGIKTIVKDKEILTGFKKLGAVIGKKTKIGINASLMPGVLIGSNCTIGPHSIVLGNIGDNITFYSKAESVIEKK